MPFGMLEQFIIPEIWTMKKLGHDVMIVPRSPKGNIENEDAKGLENISVRQDMFSWQIMKVAFQELLCNSAKSIRAFWILLHKSSRTVILKNIAVFPKALWLSRIAKEWNADHIHAHWASSTSTMALIASQISKIPWSFTAHRGDITLNNMLDIKLQTVSFARFISKDGLKITKSYGHKPAKEKTHIIHMGIQISHKKTADHLRTIDPVILVPALLFPVKGHIYLLRAMALLKGRGIKCALKIAGGGPLDHNLRREVEILDLADTVEFLGQVPHNMLLELYKQGKIDIVVLPSVDLGKNLREGIPMALAEAMGHNIPVISTDTGGIPELLYNGAGLLVPQKNPSALATAIECIIKDHQLRKELINTGRNRVVEEFSIEKCALKLAEAFTAATPESVTSPKVQSRNGHPHIN